MKRIIITTIAIITVASSLLATEIKAGSHLDRELVHMLDQKLKRHIIPNAGFTDAGLQDVVSTLASQSEVNFVLAPIPAGEEPVLTLHLKNVSMYDLVKYVCLASGVNFTIEENAVVIEKNKFSNAKSYHMETKVLRVEETADGENKYKAEIKISERKADGQLDVISAPTMVLQANKEGKISVCDEGETNGVFCTVLVNEKEDAIEALTSVTIKENGKTTWSCSQNTTLNR